MLNRDFSKSKKDYLQKNKLLLIIIGVCLLVGVLAMCIFGFNASVDYTGCYVVSVNVGSEVSSSKLDDYTKTIDTILYENKLDLYTVQVKGDGELTSLEIKYTGKLTDDKINAVNAGFVAELDVELNKISAHSFLEKSVTASDYIYTVCAGLLIAVLATLFISFRHNISYAISMLGASLFSVLGLMSVYAIFRFEISSYFLAISLVTMLYTIYEASILFENMRQIASVPENKDDKAKHITEGMKSTATRLQYTSIGLFLVGLLLVIFGTSVSRNIAINFMFGIIISLFSFTFILPLIYNLTIDKVKLKFKKSDKNKNNKDASADKTTPTAKPEVKSTQVVASEKSQANDEISTNPINETEGLFADGVNEQTGDNSEINDDSKTTGNDSESVETEKFGEFETSDNEANEVVNSENKTELEQSEKIEKLSADEVVIDTSSNSDEAEESIVIDSSVEQDEKKD